MDHRISLTKQGHGNFWGKHAKGNDGSIATPGSNLNTTLGQGNHSTKKEQL